MEKAPHVAIFPGTAMCQLIPLIEFAKRLVTLFDFRVTCIVPTIGSPPEAMKEVLQSLPPTITHVFLPSISFEDLPRNANPSTVVSLSILRSLPSLRELLKSLKQETQLAALVIAPPATDAIDVAEELNVPSCVFFPSNAMGLSFCFYWPKLDEMTSCEYKDLTEPVQIPGCVPLHGRDLLDQAQNRTNEAYKWGLRMAKRLLLAKGIVVNSFTALEPGPFKALLEEDSGRPPVYAIGPLVRGGSTHRDGNGSGMLKWLDNQPSGSVLFASFGSGGTLSQAQTNEIAHGLEMSGQRFIWVARSPNDESSNAAFFSVQSQEDPFGYLPEGFVARTEGRGLVVPSWAPQAQVLAHGSTGGFLSHCGWNSVLESVVNGVPLIAWPLFAEQRMNAVMLTEEMKVALRPRVDENGMVQKEEVAKAVKGLMEGEEGRRIRARMEKLKEAASVALGDDGASFEALSELALNWKKQIISSKH